jgi:hypothetical protein
MQSDVQYWFPAKRYGWGWGFPITWQGWVAFIGFLVLLVAGIVLMPPRHSLVGFIAYVVVLVALFTGVCWWKGEPARWRWGNERPRT